MASKLSAWLGSEGGEPRDFVVSVFVPSRTRDGIAIDHAAWRLKTLTHMARLFGGATAFGGSGAWRDDDRGGEVLVEEIAQVFSHMRKSSWNRERASQLL